MYCVLDQVVCCVCQMAPNGKVESDSSAYFCNNITQ